MFPPVILIQKGVDQTDQNNVMCHRVRVVFQIVFVFLVLCLSVPRDPMAFAGQNPPVQAGTIRVSSNLVQVPVSVTDTAGNAVKDLKMEDFSVEEDGIPVVIAHLGEPGETRLEMVLAFDVTGSVYDNFDFEEQAATRFLKTVFRTGDAVGILCIGPKPIVVLPRTTSLAAALAGLGQLAPSRGSTAFFDSVITAANILRAKGELSTRRVQIALSDGEDNFSDQRLADAMREVQRSDCIFYAINPGGPSVRLNVVSRRGQDAMEALASQTGGVAFVAEKVQDLGEVYGRIATELQAQYLLTYYAPDQKTDGGFRRITVRVPKRPELRLRARQGYYGKSPAH